MSDFVEYTWKADYVIALSPDVDPAALFKALDDAIIEIIEAHHGRAGGVSSHEVNHEEDD